MIRFVEEVVPILWRMEITTEQLLLNFVHSKEQRRLAESKGMKPEHIAALSRAYEERDYSCYAFTFVVLILLFCTFILVLQMIYFRCMTRHS